MSRSYDPASHRWRDQAWTGRQLAGGVIYELHVGTFTPQGTWTAAAEQLPYLAELGVTALELMPAKGKLAVTTPAFKDGGDIPFENTQYRSNTFPGLSWSKGPAGTKSYVVIMQDNDLLVRGAPVLHWTLFNIPAGVTKLDVGMTTPPGRRTPPGPRTTAHRRSPSCGRR